MRKKPNKLNIGNDVSADEGGILVKLLRQYMVDEDVGQYLELMINMAVNRRAGRGKGLKPIQEDVSRNKNRIMNSLKQDSITWKVFINLMSEVFGAREMAFTMTIFKPNGDVSNHTVNVDMTKVITKYDSEEIESTKRAKLLIEQVESNSAEDSPPWENSEVKDGGES